MDRGQIQDFVDEDINPALSMHDGYLRIVDIDESGLLKIELTGGCQGCSSANDTVKNAATELIKTRFPSIKDIQDVTDHAAGESPYYK